MSLTLLKHLNGSKKGNLHQFISEYEGKKEPRICWYPSAGTDFRPLLFLHPEFARIMPGKKADPTPPDIFLYSDYFPWKHSTFLDTPIIWDDHRTLVSLESMEELAPIGTARHPGILDFPEGSVATGSVLFLKIRIDSNKIGSFTMPVIYAFSCNESLCGEKLIPLKARLSHIIHVRYGGGGGGGGKSSGIWLLNVLRKLHCELFISDGHYHWQSGDYEAVRYYPELDGPADTGILESIRIINSAGWSGHGDVNWNLVTAANPVVE